MALSKLPKAFDLPSALKKGYFPYLFNTKENERYIGKLPPMKYYSADTMRTEERAIFLKWYSEHKNDYFDMENELVEYCKSDVKILTGACLEFRKLFLTQCNVEPFIESVTIASACNLLYRRNFLKPDTIGLIPKNGYRCVDNQSPEAIKWMISEERNRKINIRHSYKGKEVLINGVKVDGFCQETNQIFEYHGCYYHGHPLCLKHKRDDPLHENEKDTLNRRYETTKARTERLRDFGYEVIEMWSCVFRKNLKSFKKEDRDFLNYHELIQSSPLNPRDAFYGGRTGNVVDFYKCKEGEKIRYIDICSLYPWVCKNGKFPIGHPKIHITGDSACSTTSNLEGMNGLVKCKILPPENLLHPVLPIKQNSKLMFSLCRSCSDERNVESLCSHTDEQRALVGTWVIDEVNKAVEKGYIILNIFEIWEYNVVQYNPDKNSDDGLFTSMMNKFLKIKQEASGWPKNIQLEFSEICNNPGKRSLAKLILNSFWGKFGQRENQLQTVVVNNPSTFFHLLTHPSVEVLHILPVNEENVVVNFEMKEEAIDSLATVNVCVAAYTTTLARLKLYSYLESLGERVLYYDTDSVIYISREGEFEPPTGQFIGDMTDELESYGVGSYITEFSEIKLKANNNTLKCEVISSEDIDFSKPNSIGAILGFSKKILEANVYHESDLYVDINRVNAVRIECNIIEGTYINSQTAHILHEFAVKVSPGYKIVEAPRNVIYLPVNVKRITSLCLKKFLYVEGTISKADGKEILTTKLVNNAMAFLFDEIRYELNGKEIDCNRNVNLILK
ncbi:uncharacterized protein LOC129919242 [Episyrphus balteatus]|uniref:uncharacterized protein LOC129919242 n=1 Tax=Episyrphus balteatus TaxID=286459 RepID=UPI0024865DF5|nr:uncharacterized protein LOC129919242 [Episyrphus balteatus]